MDVVRYLTGERHSTEGPSPSEETGLSPDELSQENPREVPRALEMPELSESGEQYSLLSVSPEEIAPNPRQPRKHFDEEALKELADSIRSVGLLQPLAVRSLEDGTYELISGERRLRACKLAGMKTVPVVLLQADDREQQIMALVENMQRQNLSPVEEAASLAEILECTGESQSALAKRLGRSQASVANKLRLLRLDPEVRLLIEQGHLGERQARALVGLDPEAQILLAREAVEARIPAKDVEHRAKEIRKGSGVRRKKKDSPEGKKPSGSISGPDGPTGDLLQELVALVERRKSQGMPVMLKVRELQQSQLVVEVQVDLAHWKNSEKTEKAQKESSSEES
jgi:ParB family chromosome partitioning protein